MNDILRNRIRSGRGNSTDAEQVLNYAEMLERRIEELTEVPPEPEPDPFELIAPEFICKCEKFAGIEDDAIRCANCGGLLF